MIGQRYSSFNAVYTLLRSNYCFATVLASIGGFMYFSRNRSTITNYSCNIVLEPPSDRIIMKSAGLVESVLQ